MLKQLLPELVKHTMTDIGQSKLLKHNLSGIYSRFINQKHRLVYKIQEEIITIYIMGAHSLYGKK